MRLLAHPARCADARRADFWWLMGPNNLAQLVDKLEWAQHERPYWNASVAAARRDGGSGGGGGARHVAQLLTERGPGDSFPNAQLRLDRVMSSRFGPEINPASPSRAWLILTHNGMADLRDRGRNQGRCLNCFQPGKDVVIPFPPATIDVPDCDSLRRISLWSPVRAARATPPRRDTLFFYAGRIHPSMRHATYLTYYEGPGTRHVRADVLQHQDTPGFKIVNSWTPPKHSLGATATGASAKMTRPSFPSKAGGKAGGRAGHARSSAGRRLLETPPPGRPGRVRTPTPPTMALALALALALISPCAPHRRRSSSSSSSSSRRRRHTPKAP